MNKPFILYCCLCFLILSCHSVENGSENQDNVDPGGISSIPLINYAVVSTYPHDSTSFTEGLLFHKGRLFESTGSPQDLEFTRSLVGEVDLKTGKISPKLELDRDKYFGEGISFLNNRLYQLTYKDNLGFVYDETGFKPLGTFKFPGKEGWGMTTDSSHLIISDGTYRLFYLDPFNFKTVKTLEVNWNNILIDSLNELVPV